MPKVANTLTERGNVNVKPQVAHFERYTELIRLMGFPDEPSRFQSVFAFENLEQAKRFVQKRGEEDRAQVFEVVGKRSRKKDQNLLESASLAQAIDRGRRYWKGEGSRNPDWEILLEAPVEVKEKVEVEF